MALLHCHFFSEILQKQVAMNVILPEKGNGPFPVYYLLHGLSDDYMAWMRRSSIERYVKELPLIVAMPDGFRGFYTDNEEGPAYGRYMAEEVVGFMDKFFPTRKTREGRCIGGLSMGGYGALRLALAHPELFASVNSHSGALQAGRGVREFEAEPEFRRMFGTKPRGSAHDLHALLEKVKDSGRALPEILIDCGTEDFLYEHNTTYHAFLKEQQVPHTYREFPGAHTWEYWDKHVTEALEFHCKALGVKNA